MVLLTNNKIGAQLRKRAEAQNDVKRRALKTNIKSRNDVVYDLSFTKSKSATVCAMRPKNAGQAA